MTVLHLRWIGAVASTLLGVGICVGLAGPVSGKAISTIMPCGELA